MGNQNFTTTMLVDQTPKEVFNAVNNVQAWWIDKIDGKSAKLNDEFCVLFYQGVHYSKQKLVEFIAEKKVVWLVTESKLSFVEDENEWTGTKISFDISTIGNKTQLQFTHHGLRPDVECYKDCSNAWAGYIKGSLLELITTGKGEPTEKDAKLE
jgi:hypothetical protein